MVYNNNCSFLNTLHNVSENCGDGDFTKKDQYEIYYDKMLIVKNGKDFGNNISINGNEYTFKQNSENSYLKGLQRKISFN